MDRELLETVAAYLAETKKDAVISAEVMADGIHVNLVPNEIVDFVDFLRRDQQCRFTTLVDITAVDHPEREKRFDVVYHLLSMWRNIRIRIRCALREGEMIDTITPVHPSAGWFEREVYDMFGIFFAGHPDLRRILTDYGFRGHPLRKDFPTTGFVEVRYDEERKRVIYEPVSLAQEYRSFDFMSPWEGAKYILPGDEKGEGKEA